MTDSQDIYNSDFYEPYYCGYLLGYNPHYSIRSYGTHPGHCSNHCMPYAYLFRFQTIGFKPHSHSIPFRSWDSAYQLPGYSFLSSCYSPQDCGYSSDASCYQPRGYSYLSGAGTGYEPCGYGCRSSCGSTGDPCGFNPIPIGRSGYAYRRRYSCRPICGDPRHYGCRTYYPPSYWMELNRYYGPY